MNVNRHVYAELLKKSIVENGDRPCMHIKRNGAYRTWTYGQFHQDINRLVSALKKQGFPPLTNGVVIGENTPEWVIVWHSIFLAGGRTVPIDPNLPPDEIREIMLQTRPKFAFCSKSFARLCEDLAAEFDFLKSVIILDETYPHAGKRFDEFLAAGDPGEDAFARRFSPEDPALIIFTSGTTGKAKGVVLMQRNFTAISLFGIPRMKVGPGDTMMAVLPLHHVFGSCACLAAALAGGLDIVLIPTVNGSLILKGLREKKVSVLPGSSEIAHPVL